MAKTGREIIISVCERYANLKTYQDFGVIKMREKIGEPGEQAKIVRFYTYFEQPDFFRCEWYETNSSSYSSGYCDSRLSWLEKISGIFKGKDALHQAREAKATLAFAAGIQRLGYRGPVALIKSSLKAPSVAPVLEPFGEARLTGKVVHNKQACHRLAIEIDDSYYGEFLVSQKGLIIIRSKEAVCAGSKHAASIHYGGVLLNGEIPYQRFKKCKLPLVGM